MSLNGSKTPLTIKLLQSFYPTVSSLQAYLAQKLEQGRNTSTFLTHDTDTLLYRKLLKESYVTTNFKVLTSERFKVVPPMVHLREVIDRAQERIFSRSKGRPSNVITAGYRNANRNGDGVKLTRSRVCLANYFVNTIITALQAQEWHTLFQRIGEDAMFHLLTDTSIFVPLPNDCLCQVTGEPIVHMKPPSAIVTNLAAQVSQDDAARLPRCELKRKANDALDGRPPKRQKTHASVACSTDKATHRASIDAERRTPMDIAIVRARMFYYRPCLVPRTNVIAFGLPPKHVLNRLNPSTRHNASATCGARTDFDPRKAMDNARHLAKYVFPRQYGLPNPFKIDSSQYTSLRLPDYFDREAQIKAKGSCKAPKRLKSVLGVLEKLIWRHGKCGYKPLLNKVCPSKVRADRDSPLDSSIILEMMSEHSSQLCSQAMKSDPSISVDSMGKSILPCGLSQAQRQVKNKPRFAEFACSYAEVYCYAVLVTKLVIPDTFWGSERNWKLMKRNIKEFISLRRYETLTLHAILQDFSTADCNWLMPDSPGASRQARVSVTDSLKRRELLEEFLFWYFDSFLIPLLRTTFYVTESSAFRNRVLYFRQDDWTTLCAPLIERLSSETFVKIPQNDAEEILRQRKLGFSFVRLLPKETGVRPIVNLRRKRAAGKNIFGRAEPSINQVLQAAFQILTYEKEAHQAMLGASVFGHNEIYTKLKAFKSRLTSGKSTDKLPKLYFVKVDVQACFDTIEQEKLLQIIQEVISEDRYMIQRHGQVTSVTGKIRRNYVKKATPEDDHPHFLSFAAKLADALRNTIFVDQVVYPYAKKQEVIELLEEHITENIVKIGDSYYRQTVGIPQGSVLSALLCSFFYGDLERMYLKFTDDLQSLLLRMIDDYLFITTSLTRARRFLAVMKEGHPEYGCFISRDKTLTNFDDNEMTNNTEPNQKAFPWCGYLIDMSDLSVSTDYSRFHSTYLQDSLTVEVGRRAGINFTQKMMQLAKSKSHIIYCDADLNSSHVVHVNIYQNFALLAMKMHHYIRSWKLNVARSTAFILTSIRHTIRYTNATIRSKASNKVARASRGRCEVQEDSVRWLGLHAFYTVFSRKPHLYSAIVSRLGFDLRLPRYSNFKRRYRPVIIKGLETLELLAF